MVNTINKHVFDVNYGGFKLISYNLQVAIMKQKVSASIFNEPDRQELKIQLKRLRIK